MRFVIAALVLAGGLALPTAAHAACTVTTSGVSFGNYDVYSGSHLDSTGTISVTCTNNNNNVTVTMSTGGSGSYSTRKMDGPGGDRLDYNLYTNSSRTTIWGNGSGGTGFAFMFDVDVGETPSRTVYGRVFSGQDVTAGSYSDSVTVTINY